CRCLYVPFIHIRIPPTSTLFPYTTLFRSLDEANRDLLLQLLRDYPEPCGILFLSHDTAALTALCGEIMVLERGQIIERAAADELDRKSTRLNSSHVSISYAVFCLKKKKDV